MPRVAPVLPSDGAAHERVADSPFAVLAHQPRVRSYFEKTLREHKLSHAYLLCGTSETDKQAAAQALAFALICPQQACMACDECTLLAQGIHPDVHRIAPEGSAGYLVEQLKELMRDVALRPTRSETKLYLIERAELLGAASANALLKTLEEPPPNTVFVLFATHVAAVLPTIVSRCQVVPFKTCSSHELYNVLATQSDYDEDELRLACALTHDITEARTYLASESRKRAGMRMLDVLLSLHEYDLWQLLQAASELCELIQLPSHELKEQFEVQLKESEEYLFKQGSKRLAERHKRELSARERSGMIELVATAEYYLQELLVIRTTHAQHARRGSCDERMALCARSTSEANIMAAREVCRQMRDNIAHNITAQLVVETMLISIKEALTCPPLFP